ncbi:hypothetical protein [Microaceticoccus formicicus]|uniref:hypothetical protein n=1 Tax=Microaceticoccus formicicus TaxID=3118105 RepID=UPI003CD0413A|nr:hypothetical protein VZL98_09435 [Peptoniphilaceae bacterium AMB_02]
MKKTITIKIALVMLLIICFNIVTTSVNASEVDDLIVEIKDQDYYNNLISNNEDLKNRIKELEHHNFMIDHNVMNIKGVDFIYYTNDDNSTVGLIQIHEDLSSEIRVNSVDSVPETIEFIKEDGNKMILGKDNEGAFNNILYSSPEYITYGSPWWCPYLVGLVGTSVSALYTKTAFLVGGPVAAVIVAGVSSVGWTYVTNQCK